MISPILYVRPGFSHTPIIAHQVNKQRTVRGVGGACAACRRSRRRAASALTASPRLLVLDEPVSSLDVSVRAGILELLAALRSDGVALVVISHDLAVLEHLVDRVLVMSEGRIVDSGPTREPLTDPVTRELVEAVPRLQRAES
ncbi:MAG TPA: AAA family ATPase [Pseudonocardia sp.]|uniref:AAA family ATPase n=1 Tax=Pseudonocardia sp. TaxID=60912 RepID=UPI002F40DC10